MFFFIRETKIGEASVGFFLEFRKSVNGRHTHCAWAAAGLEPWWWKSEEYDGNESRTRGTMCVYCVIPFSKKRWFSCCLFAQVDYLSVQCCFFYTFVERHVFITSWNDCPVGGAATTRMRKDFVYKSPRTDLIIASLEEDSPLSGVCMV